jgi:primase-polymerase (primpol)-like protein
MTARSSASISTTAEIRTLGRPSSGALATIHDEYVQPDDERRIPESDRGAERTMSASFQQDLPTLSDEELLARARNAANGEKFHRLWRGDTSGYDSYSEADMALSCLLAFWTGGNRTRMDAVPPVRALPREMGRDSLR